MKLKWMGYCYSDGLDLEIWSYGKKRNIRMNRIKLREDRKIREMFCKSRSTSLKKAWENNNKLVILNTVKRTICKNKNRNSIEKSILIILQNQTTTSADNCWRCQCGSEMPPCVTQNFNEERWRSQPDKVNFNIFYSIEKILYLLYYF